MTPGEFVTGLNKGTGNTIASLSLVFTESDTKASLEQGSTRIAVVTVTPDWREVKSVLMVGLATVEQMRRIQRAWPDLEVK